MRHCILIAIVLYLVGCTNDEVGRNVDNTVHLAGYLGVPDAGCVAGYWKDGVHSNLPGDSTNSSVQSLYVDGTSVFIGGWKRGTDPTRAVIWRDGIETIVDESFGGTTLIAARGNNLFGAWYDISEGPVFLKDGVVQPIADTSLNIWPTGLALLGEDMYLSGCSSYHDWTSPDSKTFQHAQCWKNGQLIFRETELSNAMAIFIHRNDIYMAGYHETSQGINACYWKNGQRTDLTGEKAIARSIFVTESHVYVSGVIDNQAVYWKDGEAIYLTTEGTNSMANSIFVHGSDVHVGGHEQGHPAYWKNDVKENITGEEEPGQILFVVVGSN
jgi:hypothetical protein